MSIQTAQEVPETPTDSARVRLARAVLEGALAVDGVVAGSAGPLGLRAERTGDQQLAGVVVVADASGGYAVSLHLVVRLVPLPALAAAVRSAVEARAAAVGLAADLARLDVVFEDLVLPEESG